MRRTLRVKPKEKKKLLLLRRHLTSRGIRLTPLRTQVWIAFTRVDHVTAKQLLRHMRESLPGIGLDAVYRTLGQFCKVGVAKRRHYESETYYDNIFLEKATNHLICTSCRRILNFYHEQIGPIAAIVASQHGYLIEKYKLEVYGACKSCNRHASPGRTRVPRQPY
jgi:Fur family ferric uptake transcriptional regulator